MVGRPVSIVTVVRDGIFFTRLLVDKVRASIGSRPYEIIVVDRGSRDGSIAWFESQPDVRLLRYPQPKSGPHGHGEAAEYAVERARYERIALLDSDAHPVDETWLSGSLDRLDAHTRLAGAEFGGAHTGNPYKWYVHPFFMCFFRSDLGGLVVLRKLRGETTDTGEEATIRVLDSGRKVVAHPMEDSEPFYLGRTGYPCVAGGVFHAWYVSRLEHTPDEVARETDGAITDANYRLPLMAKLRAHYGLAY